MPEVQVTLRVSNEELKAGGEGVHYRWSPAMTDKYEGKTHFVPWGDTVTGKRKGGEE